MARLFQSLWPVSYTHLSATTANLNTPPDPIIQVYGGLDDEKLIGYLYKAQNRIYDILNNKAPEKICNYDNRFTLVENAISMTMKKVQEMSITIMRIRCV